MLSYHYAFMDLFSEVCRLWGMRVKKSLSVCLAALRSFIEIQPWPSRLSRLCCNSFGFVPSMTFLSHTWAIITLLTWNIQTSNTIHLYTTRIATSHYHDTHSILLPIDYCYIKMNPFGHIYDMYNHDTSKQNRPHEWTRGKAKRWTTHFTRDFRINRSLWRSLLESQPPGGIPTQYGKMMIYLGNL